MTDERSRRFEQDLGAVLRQVAGDGAPASLRYHLADVVATPPLERRSWFSPPLRWAAVAVAVIAVAVLAFLMVPHENVGPVPTSTAEPSATPAAESGSPSPSSEASPTASPSVSPAPSATPIPTAVPVAWTSLTWSAPVAVPGYVRDVVPWGSGYVGIGAAWRQGGLDAAFYTSADGVHWTVAARKSIAAGDVIVERVVRAGTRLLAVGNAIAAAPGEKPDSAPLLWESTDGKSWTQVHSPTWDAALWGRGVSRLISRPEGLLAVSLGSDPIVLHSTDGSSWARVTLPVAERAIANDAIGYSGGFVIVGRDGQPDHFSEAVMESQAPPGVGRPAAWVSADGVLWSEATVEGAKVAGAGLGQVVAVHSGLLATGINSTADFYDSVTTSWTSIDGSAWSIASGARWPGDPYTPILVADGEHALLLAPAPGGKTLAAWATSDGLRWTRLDFASTDNAPVIDCGGETCVRVDAAWIEPDQILVMAGGGSTDASGGTGVWFWMTTPGS